MENRFSNTFSLDESLDKAQQKADQFIKQTVENFDGFRNDLPVSPKHGIMGLIGGVILLAVCLLGFLFDYSAYQITPFCLPFVGGILFSVYIILKRFITIPIGIMGVKIRSFAKDIRSKIALSSDKKTQIKNAVRNNNDMEFSEDLSLTAKIQSVYRSMDSMTRIAGRIKPVIMLVILIVFGFFVNLSITNIFAGKESIAKYPVNMNDYYITLLLLSVMVFINIFMFSVAPFFRRRTKPAGIILSALFCTRLGFLMSSSFTKASVVWSKFRFRLEIPSYIFVPLMIFAGMVIMITSMNIGVESEKYENGYELSRSYGGNANCGKSDFIWRYVVYLINFTLANAIAELCIAEGSGNIIAYIIPMPFYWWAMNHLIRPRGNKAYAFWGRKKCIANEIFQMICILSMVAVLKGQLDFNAILYVLGVFVSAKIVGLLMTFLNNIIY